MTRAQAAEWREVFQDLGLNPVEAKTAVQYAANALKDGPVSDEVRAAWRAENHEYLRRTFGVNAPKVLAEAEKFVKRDWRFAHWLQETGLGDSPHYLKLAIEKMRSRR